jgi:hypothetical protein
MSPAPIPPRRAALLAALALLAACAAPAQTANMIAPATAAARPFPAAFANAMCVRNVSGGQETSPLMTSQVDDASFRAALEASLRQNGLLADASACRYHVDATLVSLMQPTFGLDIRVGALVNYKVEDPSGAILFREPLASGYTAKLSDSLVGVDRLRLANEGAIRTSIGDFLDRLRELKPG